MDSNPSLQSQEIVRTNNLNQLKIRFLRKIQKSKQKWSTSTIYNLQINKRVTQERHKTVKTNLWNITTKIQSGIN